MPRRKPASAKQKKEALQLKRAVKRGDAPPPEPKPDPRRRRHGAPGRSTISGHNNSAEIESSRKLQSAFVKVSADFLEETKILASTVPLPRPLPAQASLFPESLVRHTQDAANLKDGLSCPRRPKWRFDMSKKEVEKNEEGVYKKWLVQMDQIVEDWRHQGMAVTEADLDQQPDEEKPPAKPKAPRAPTHFERNLEVWRQLWRVNEISQILLVLLDSRCPLLHFPPSLASYLASRAVILVLTKVDIAGPARADAWTAYLRARHPGLRIVRVESYIQRETESRQGARTARDPHLPLPFREQLVSAIREVHSELLEPPERIREDEEKVKRWKPPVKREVDWEAVLNARGGQVGMTVGGATAPKPTSEDDREDLEEEGGDSEAEPQHLTIGLIGQPNVGKSSLLNALFGTQKVRASRTPGKTKHFQTLFWTPEVRLVDCPGLVMPNFVPMEMQVLSGILPISRVSAVPACIHYAAQLLPLERVLQLEHPATRAPPVEDKRTWREGTRPEAGASAQAGRLKSWTAMDVLSAYADKKGWVTAKAGRPDVNRAGNAILRALAEGKIRWAFWPPEAQVNEEAAEFGHGIWIEGSEGEDGATEESDDDEKALVEEASEEDVQDEIPESEEEEDDGVAEVVGSGRFGALALVEEAEGTDDEEE